MSTLILSFLKKDSNKHQKILKNLEAAAVSKGQIVEVKDAKLERTRSFAILFAVLLSVHISYAARFPLRGWAFIHKGWEPWKPLRHLKGNLR